MNRSAGSAAVLCATVLITSCARGGRAEASATTSVEAPTVAVVKASRADLSNDLLLTAEFEPFQEVDVMAKVSGYIKQINVDIGDRVQQGQLLATLEIPEMQDDLTRAAAAIDEANADLTTARDELTRAEAARDNAHPSYLRVLDVSQADQARVKTLFQYAVITAPFTGVVTKRYANSGSLIQAGTASQTQAMPVVRLSENGLLRLALPVPESAVPLIHLGGMVNVRVSAMNRSFPGRVARFADKVDESTRTMKTEVDVPNPSLLLVPGMYAEVDLVTEQHRNVLSVPVEAVDGSGSSARVFAVEPTGKIQIIPVTLGIETARGVEILPGDLKDGDEVVVGLRSMLKQGGQVQPKVISLQTDSGAKS